MSYVGKDHARSNPILSAQVDEAQKKIQSAMQVAIQTQRGVQGLSTIAGKAKMIAQMAAAKMESETRHITQRVHEQKTQSVQEAQAAK